MSWERGSPLFRQAMLAAGFAVHEEDGRSSVVVVEMPPSVSSEELHTNIVDREKLCKKVLHISWALLESLCIGSMSFGLIRYTDRRPKDPWSKLRSELHSGKTKMEPERAGL